MLLLCATRFARALFGGCKPVVALHLLCVIALVTGCHSSSGSYSPPTAQLTAIAIGPPDSSVATGHYVYAANHGGNTVSQYSLGTGGALTFIGTAATGSGPNAVDTGL
jgi:hypothetical protein